MIPTKTSLHPAERLVAALLLVIAAPLVLVGAAVSFAHYRRWPFFVHERVGRDGRRFNLVKIRTLPPSTDPYADKYSLQRVPPLMELARRLHFDEIPQLVHVVLGQMRFVGPRPEMPVLHEALPRPFATARTAVLPGLTCLWQISPHSAGLIGERTEYDRLYVEYRSPRLEIWILGRTLLKMATGRTTSLHQIPQWAMAPSLASGTASGTPGHASTPSAAPISQPAGVGLVD